jgi:hypothetical protein
VKRWSMAIQNIPIVKAVVTDLIKQTDRQTTDRHRQTDRDRHRQTDRPRDRQIDR